MSKPLFSSGTAAKPIPEERPVKALFEADPPKSNANIEPPVVKPPVIVEKVPTVPVFGATPVKKEEPVKNEVPVSPLNFEEKKVVRQQPVGSAIFEGIRSFTDQAKDEITAVIPSATFMQIEFLQDLVVSYYKLGFEVWQKYFNKIGRENVDINEDLHQSITTHSSLRATEAIKIGTDFVSGNSGGFLGLGKKSYEEVFGLLNAALAPKDQIRMNLKGLKTRAERLHAQIKLVLDVTPNMPSVKESDKIIQYLTPLESSVLMLQSEIKLFEAGFERDVSALERLLFSQLPALRSRS